MSNPSNLQPDPSDSQPDPSDPQPDPSGPQPDLSDPQPDLSDPQPDLSDPQPDLSDPQPDQSSLQPGLSNPQPDSSDLPPSPLNPQPGPSDSQPGASDSVPRLPNPGIRNMINRVYNKARPNYKTAHLPACLFNPHPGISDSQPGISDSQPGISDSQPGISDSQPGSSDSQPGLPNPGIRKMIDRVYNKARPNYKTAHLPPCIFNPQPGLLASQPGPSNLQPGLSNPQPDLPPGPLNPQPGPLHFQPGPSDYSPELPNPGIRKMIHSIYNKANLHLQACQSDPQQDPLNLQPVQAPLDLPPSLLNLQPGVPNPGIRKMICRIVNKVRPKYKTTNSSLDLSNLERGPSVQLELEVLPNLTSSDPEPCQSQPSQPNQEDDATSNRRQFVWMPTFLQNFSQRISEGIHNYFNPKPCVFTDEEIEEYMALTYLSKEEIVRIYDLFCSYGPQYFDGEKNPYLPRHKVMKLPEFKVNPFRERLMLAISQYEDFLTFEDYLDLKSVFSEKAPVEMKAEYAFKMFDFNFDDMISLEDLVGVLRHLDQDCDIEDDDKKYVASQIILDADVDGDGSLAFVEFLHLMKRLEVDFKRSFSILV